MDSTRICVIGAGPSGITALKNVLDQGLEAVAYDRNAEVGGNWIFSEDITHSSVFETTHIISSKTLSQYEDYTFDDFDKNIPDYPSHENLKNYFQAYARHFGLESFIHFNTEVLHCQLQDDSTWDVTIRQNSQERTEHFTHLLVCNGHHWHPRMPEFKGDFNGEILHSHHFKKAAAFSGKRVLVIGGGNSACDVAVETSRVSKKTTISWRRGYKIIPKFVMGIPSDVMGERLKWLPLRLRDKLTDILVHLLVGPNKLYGLQEPNTRFGETHPTINDELLYKIRHGKVHPKVDVDHLDGHTVHFKDGSQDDFDVIICCTGFRISHPFFERDFIDYSEGPVPLYLRMLHPEIKSLYFIGLFQPLGCIWPGAELQSKITAREIAGLWQRPTDIKQRIEHRLKKPHYKQIETPRHTITVDYHQFHKELLQELPNNYIQKEPIKETNKTI